MAEKKGERTKVKAARAGVALEFELDAKQQKALMACLKRTGKITVSLQRVGTTKLPGRGLLDDTDGELID